MKVTKGATAVLISTKRIGYGLVTAALVLAPVLWALVAGVPTAKAASSSAEGGLIAQGAAIYNQNCSACHGANAAGGESFGTVSSADIRGYYLNHDLRPYTSSTLQRAILEGVDQNGQPLNSVMPRWQGMLSQGQVTALVAYLDSLGPLQAGSAPVNRPAHIPLAPAYMFGSVVVAVLSGVWVLQVLGPHRTGS